VIRSWSLLVADRDGEYKPIFNDREDEIRPGLLMVMDQLDFVVIIFGVSAFIWLFISTVPLCYRSP